VRAHARTATRSTLRRACGRTATPPQVYWYTVEFGVVREEGGIKAFGSGILSSFGELEHMGKVCMCRVLRRGASWRGAGCTPGRPGVARATRALLQALGQ
jgi:hypothetical protein